MSAVLNVPFGDIAREVNEIRESLQLALDRVIDSGRFVLGPEVEDFEQEFARWLGVDHAVGVASGTEAITLALKSLGVGEGDEVITVANTCVPTAVGIAGSGATIRLADCESDTLMLSINSVEAAITSKTRAVVPVHLYGNCVDMERLRKLADHHNIFIVEDCAQAVGSTVFAQSAGTFGDASAFSFYPTKNLGAYGDGGCVVTSDATVAEKLRSIRNYGYQERDYSVELGLNSRLDPIQAAILRVKLPHVDAWNERRIALAEKYHEGLSAIDGLVPQISDSVVNPFHIYPVLVRKRDDVKSKLQEAGVQTLVHYPTPLHLQPALSNLGYEIGAFPNAERACSQVLSLPMFPQLRNDEVEWVIESLCKVIENLH